MKQNFLLLGIGGLLAAALSLPACENTAKGFGRDMEQAGRNIQNSVSRQEAR